MSILDLGFGGMGNGCRRLVLFFDGVEVKAGLGWICRDMGWSGVTEIGRLKVRDR